jgi:protein-tyrosine phosphatase
MDIMRKGHSDDEHGTTQIWERLWLGSLADAERLAEANPNGITTVISLSGVAVRSMRNGVDYLRLPIEDEQPVPISRFYEVMDAIRKSIRWGTVLIHCSEGVSRAPSMAAAWMHCVGYSNIDAALAEIKRLRPFISPSDTLIESIRRHL